jgi:putative spermidine/putrescine transport system substrate-binding protein
MRERSAARKRRINRRDALAAVAGALPYVWIPGAAARQQVVVRTSGGGYDEARKAAVYDAFRKETGIDVVLVAANATKLLALAKTGGGGIDVIDTDDDTLIQIDRAGGLEPIDYAGFKYTDINDLPAAVRRARYVGHSYFATILGYNTRTYTAGKEPRSWAEYWDTKRYPGPRALPSAAIGEPTLEFALLADGVPMDKLYPLDIARAFRKLGTIRSSIVTFWETGALSAQLLSDNEAALAAIWNTRLYEAKAKGAPVGAQWNQNQGGLVAFGISKGTRNLDAAKRFVDFSLSGATQCDGCGPMPQSPPTARRFPPWHASWSIRPPASSWFSPKASCATSAGGPTTRNASAIIGRSGSWKNKDRFTPLRQNIAR